jgi:alkanesulfonate monooxygenase SsuD/methylene tetrahydromethanopterin reductase-like flavin-dependent oxidoreductase (luciferase family)
MKLCVSMFNTDYSIRIDDLAREAEAWGFESLWVPEHTHIPKSRKSPWPGGPNLPNRYPRCYNLRIGSEARPRGRQVALAA